MSCPLLSARKSGDGKPFDEARTYCAAVDEFVKPVRADICNDRYDRYLDGEPLIVTAALTGGVHGKEANPNLPETPEEIGRAATVEEAGATVVHLHARKPSGERTFATGRFQGIDDAVR